jgi:uncharacterized phage infection (PIP) family protein YhgE
MKLSIALMLVATALAATACGESKSDKAKTQVCDARADIGKQVAQLQALTLSTASVDGVTTSLRAIQDGVGKITDAQGALNSERKQQVQAANQQFAAQVKAIVQNVGRSVSVKDSGTQFKQATTQLADSYRQTLAKVDCG